MTTLLFLHFIGFVCWFAGLFYLPRLFVYHSATDSDLVYQQFLVMEHRLYYYIMAPAAIVTVLSGIGLMHILFAPSHHVPTWLIIKLILVAILIIFHLACGYYYRQFKNKTNSKRHPFFRVFNEIPTVLLLLIIALALWQPSL